MSRSTFTQHQAMILLVCVVFMGLMHVAEAGSTLHVNDLFLSYITISAIGLVINIGSLAILSTIRSKYVQLTLLNIGTNILDVIYLIILLIINVNSYQHASHYSLTFSEAGCDADVICAITFTIWSITLVVGLSFIAKRDLWDGVKYSVAEIIGLELATGLYALGAALAVTFMTDNGTTLDDSLSYCILSRHNSLPYIISIALLTVPVLFMVYNIYLIFLSIQYAQDLLDTSGIVIIAKQQQYESMKKLSYIILTKILFCIPVVASDFIRIVKGETNPSLSAISGIIITLVPAIVDPIVYLLINEDLQKKAKDIWDNFRLWSSVRVSYIADESNWNSPCNKKLKDWKYWMGNETRREILLDYAKQEYVFENFLFYDDVVKYRELGTELKVLVDTIPPNRQTILQKWSEFSKYANKIYTLFIQLPSAPLEININSKVRNKLLGLLLANNSDMKSRSINPRSFRSNRSVRSVRSNRSSHSSYLSVRKRNDGVKNSAKQEILEVAFPNISNMTIIEIKVQIDKYNAVFDDCLELISALITSDVWPRFLRSDTYKNILYGEEA